MKKVISMLLSVVMLLTVTAGLDLTAYAKTYSGTCGENITWSFNTSTGALTLTGTGDMSDYADADGCLPPWYEKSESNDLIKTVTISDGITSIGDYAFMGCSLTSISIPDSVTSIGKDAFAFLKMSSLTIPDTVTTISDYAFEYTYLKTVTIGSGVTSIGKSAFIFCSKLTSFTVSADNAYYTSQDGVLFTKDMSTLVQYPLGNKRTTYSIPSGVVTIGDESFHEARNLKKINIANTVTTIGEFAFDCCDGLKNLTLPDSVTTIKQFAFWGCMFNTVTIGTGVKKVSKGAFVDCGTIASVVYKGTKAQWKNIKFGKWNECITKSTVKCTNGYLSICKSYILKTTSKSKGQLTVKVCKISSVDGYQIQYATNKKFTESNKTVTVKGKKNTTKTLKNLKSNQTYYVRVRTYKVVNGKKMYSNWSSAYSVKTK